MKILITGGAGFIGSHLVESLYKEHEVVVLDNLSTGKFRNLSSVKKYRFVKADILNYVFKDEQFDYIFHLASNADIRDGTQNTFKDIRENFLSTHRILEFMRKRDNKKIIFASTAAIYGETEHNPISEHSRDFLPISMYGMTKLSAEKMIHTYHNNYGIHAWIFRFGNITGPRNTHGVIRDLVYKLTQNPDILEILGDGNQIKQYLDVKDCISALTQIGLNTQANYEVYNLATEEFMTVRELADIVIDEMKLNPKISYSGGDRGWIGDVPYTVLDTKKIRDLGWKSKISSEESIRNTVRYLINNQ